MKYFFVGAITLFALASVNVARAADMPAKAPPSPVASAYSWTGFYVGGNLGYGWGRTNNEVIFVDPFFPLTVAHSESDGLNSVIGGGQFGYNYQFSTRAVLGLEADWQSSSKAVSRSFVGSAVVGVPVNTESATTNYTADISWFGTVRGRVGYSWDSLLLYGTGGLAYGKVGLSGTMNQATDLTGAGGPIFNLSSPFSMSTVKAGWAVGAGIEDALTNNWSWKLEYLYVDLGTIAGLFPVPNPFIITSETITAKSRFTDNILRLGLNYRFD
jgi:outer membrane immunogenic protein